MKTEDNYQIPKKGRYNSKINVYLGLLGIRLNKKAPLNTLKNIKFFFKDLNLLKQQKGNDNAFPIGPMFPFLDNRNVPIGTMSGGYFHQDLHVARRIYQNNPYKHLDIGSAIQTFICHVASYRDVEMMDFSPHVSRVKGISYTKADLMKLPEGMVNYCDSISSLHAIEHFGLGRYGDPVDYYGHVKAIENITRMLKGGGTFYLSVPIGKQRIEFNAHRIFSVEYLVDLVTPSYDIRHFSYVDDDGDFYENVELTENGMQNSFGCYSNGDQGLGIFELVKK